MAQVRVRRRRVKAAHLGRTGAAGLPPAGEATSPCVPADLPGARAPAVGPHPLWAHWWEGAFCCVGMVGRAVACRIPFPFCRRTPESSGCCVALRLGDSGSPPAREQPPVPAACSLGLPQRVRWGSLSASGWLSGPWVGPHRGWRLGGRSYSRPAAGLGSPPRRGPGFCGHCVSQMSGERQLVGEAWSSGGEGC